MKGWLSRQLAPPAKRPSLGNGLLPLLFGGIFAYVVFALFVWPHIRVDLHWYARPCAVLEGRIGETEGSDDATLYRAELRIRYEIDGEVHEIWSTRPGGSYSSGKSDKAEDLAEHPPRGGYTCWVNPKDQNDAVLLRGVEPIGWPFFLGPLILALGGARSLWYWHALRDKSAEEIAHHAAAEAPPAPWLPAPATRPGQTLAHRLRFAADLRAQLGGAFGAAVFLAGGIILSVASLNASRNGLGGAISGMVMGFVFLLVAAGLLYAVLKKAFVALVVPETVLEISAAPVRPGEPFEVRIEQRGAASFLSYAVSLVCAESATYTVGTDSTTKTHEAFRKDLLPSRAFDVTRAEPFVHSARFTLPREAMHSFEGKHNKIAWKLVVTATTARGFSLAREAPLAVHPPRPRRPGAYREAGHA